VRPPLAHRLGNSPRPPAKAARRLAVLDSAVANIVLPTIAKCAIRVPTVEQQPPDQPIGDPPRPSHACRG